MIEQSVKFKLKEEEIRRLNKIILPAEKSPFFCHLYLFYNIMAHRATKICIREKGVFRLRRIPIVEGERCISTSSNSDCGRRKVYPL